MPWPARTTDPILRGREVALGRLVAAVLGLGLILAGPVLRQTFGLHDRHLTQWRMFSGIGVGLVEARFYAVDGQGTWQRIDRYEVLGEPRSAPVLPARTLPASFRLLTSPDAVAEMGARLCQALGAGTDLRVVSRVARQEGWAELNSGKDNLCRSVPPGLAQEGTRP